MKKSKPRSPRSIDSPKPHSSRHTTPKFSKTQNVNTRYAQSNNQYVKMQSPVAQSVRECFEVQSASNKSNHR